MTKQVSFYNSENKKIIGFLATGSEIINGDLHESNCHLFSKLISEKGGEIFQHLHASDKKDEIISAIEYLLGKCDAIIITGGLGPTSDDNTRFAVSEFTQQDLYFDEEVWSNIVARLKKFHLHISESNKNQAFFPLNAIIYPNTNGTACGFQVRLGQKIIFVLPGPPRECTPMFQDYVIRTLEDESFFNQKSLMRWVTLGLIESETAQKIDDLATDYDVVTGYRWHYPYLEIKLVAESFKNFKPLLEKIDSILKDHLVSNEQKNAFDLLQENMLNIHEEIFIVDNISAGILADKALNQNIKFLQELQPCNQCKRLLVLKSSPGLLLQNEDAGTITFECTGFIENTQIYSHNISVPYRSKEVLDYAKHYAAWQLNKFLTII